MFLVGYSIIYVSDIIENWNSFSARMYTMLKIQQKTIFKRYSYLLSVIFAVFNNYKTTVRTLRSVNCESFQMVDPRLSIDLGKINLIGFVWNNFLAFVY